MPIWNVFKNHRKKQLQMKRNQVRLLARNRGVQLSDDQLDLFDLVMLDMILDLGFFTDDAAAMVGAEIPQEVLDAEREAGIDIPVAADVIDEAVDPYEAAREIADNTEAVSYDEANEGVQEPEPVVEPERTRVIPDPEPISRPEPISTPDPEPTRSSGWGSSDSDSGSSWGGGGDSGGGGFGD